MRRYMTFARIFLTLFIINFARAAPVVVRGENEVHVNVVDRAGDNTATSQERPEPVQAASEESSSNPLPPRPPSTDVSWPNQLPARPARPDLSWPELLPARPARPDLSWPDLLPASPARPNPSWPSQLAPGRPHPFSWPDHLSSKILPSNPDSSAGPHQAAVDHPPSSSEPSHPTDPKTEDLISKLGTGPTDPETMNLVSQLENPLPKQPQGPRPETKYVLGEFLKHRIKRHIPDSAVVNPVQESQTTMIDSTSYVFGSSPSPANLQHLQDPVYLLIAPATSATSGVIRRGAGTPLHSPPDYSQNRKKFGIA